MSPRQGYRDRLAIMVEFREGGAGGTVEEVWISEAHGVVLDDADLPFRELAEAVTTNGKDFYPHEIQRRESIYNWGASGAAETILLGLSIAALDRAIIEPTLRAVLAKVRGRSPAGIAPRVVEEQEAETRSRWFVVEHFKLDCERDDLMLLSTEHDLERNVWTLVFEHQGYRYAVDLQAGDDLTAFTKIRKQAVS